MDSLSGSHLKMRLLPPRDQEDVSLTKLLAFVSQCYNDDHICPGFGLAANNPRQPDV
jgi:hypothetical protein